MAWARERSDTTVLNGFFPCRDCGCVSVFKNETTEPTTTGFPIIDFGRFKPSVDTKKKSIWGSGLFRDFGLSHTEAPQDVTAFSMQVLLFFYYNSRFCMFITQLVLYFYCYCYYNRPYMYVNKKFRTEDSQKPTNTSPLISNPLT